MRLLLATSLAFFLFAPTVSAEDSAGANRLIVEAVGPVAAVAWEPSVEIPPGIPRFINRLRDMYTADAYEMAYGGHLLYDDNERRRVLKRELRNVLREMSEDQPFENQEDFDRWAYRAAKHANRYLKRFRPTRNDFDAAKNRLLGHLMDMGIRIPLRPEPFDPYVEDNY